VEIVEILLRSANCKQNLQCVHFCTLSGSESVSCRICFIDTLEKCKADELRFSHNEKAAPTATRNECGQRSVKAPLAEAESIYLLLVDPLR